MLSYQGKHFKFLKLCKDYFTDSKNFDSNAASILSSPALARSFAAGKPSAPEASSFAKA